MDRFTIDYWKLGEQESVPVCAYRTDRPGYIGVPRQAGLKLISGEKFVDQRSDGAKVRFRKQVKPWDYQEPFIADMCEAAWTDYPDFMAYAATGKGKTVCATAVIGKLGRTTLIVVDQERLMEQWIGEVKKHLGCDESISTKDIMKGRGQEIGVVQGQLCAYEGRKVVVAMLQSLSQKIYDKAFYDYFGVVVFDEVHTTGAPFFSVVLMDFSAKVRFGVSATPNRRDALKKLIEWSIGEIEAHLGQKHFKSRVYYLESDAVVSWYSNMAKVSGRYLTELAEHASRNLLLIKAIIWLWEDGRDVLIVSDRAEQLFNLMSLCRYHGIPDADMGLYTRKKLEWGYEKDPKPPRRPPFWEKDTEYTPVVYTLKTGTMPKAALAETIESKPLIFATYGMFEKGVDVVRLSAGLDCTPRAKAVQLHGRILRAGKDKRVPIWVTVRDVNSFRAENQFASRLSDYLESNAEVYLWNIEKGIIKQDAPALRAEARARVEELKREEIITRRDGSYTLVTPNTPTGSDRPHGTRTAKRIPYRRVS